VGESLDSCHRDGPCTGRSRSSGPISKTDKSYRQFLIRKSCAVCRDRSGPAGCGTPARCPFEGPLTKGTPVGSKWLTLVLAGSLGIMAWLSLPSGGAVLAVDDETGASQLGNTDERRRALELVRQATVELKANRLDAARRLARQAADLNATYSLFDVRPEHVLAEIERKEKSGGLIAGTPGSGSEHEVKQPAKPAAGLAAAAPEPADPFETLKADASAKSASSSDPPAKVLTSALPELDHQPHVLHSETPPSHERVKARAIEILDRGLQALDERRLDDAERYARAALALNASFSRLEYKPEYLITEVGIARARLRLDAATSQPILPGSKQAASSGAIAQTAARTGAQYPPEVSLAGDRQVQPASPAPSAAAAPPATPSAQAYAPAQSTASAQGAGSSRERAERLLQEALTDLRAGRDDVARARIEGALGVIHPGAPRTLPLFPGASPTLAAPQAAPNADLTQHAMPRAGLPSYMPDKARDEHDVALKPLHDPYLGDEPNSTNKGTAGEKSFRETLPNYAPLSSALSLNRPLPTISDEPAQQPAAASSSAIAGAGRAQTVADTDNQPAKVRWPESQPAPTSQSAVPLAPSAPTVQANGRSGYSSPSGYAPTATDPWVKAPTEDPHPGYFRRLWNALTGD
jgi:hypothetical protein